MASTPIRFTPNKVSVSAVTSIGIESGRTLRKVRRIIEKRVCQDYWNQRDSGRNTARSRYAIKHRVSNHLRNIYGFVPNGFRYAA